MSAHPQITSANSGSLQGVAAQFADVKRQLSAVRTQAGSIPPNSVSGTQIQDNTISAKHIIAGTITATEIQAGTITAEQIAAQSITANLIAADTITANQISAATITGDRIAAGTLTATNIAAGTITASQIAAGTITASLMASNSIASSAIISGAVTASKISVTQLDAVASFMGTVTGGIFQTGTTGARVMMGTSISTSSGTKNGIVAVDGSGNITMLADAATGTISLVGQLLTGSTGLGNLDGVTQNSVLSISGANLCDNPQLTSTDVSPFIPTNATVARDTTTYLTAPASLKATTTSTSTVKVTFQKASAARAAAVAAQRYSFSAFVFTPAARTVTITVAFYDGSSALINSTGQVFTSLAGQWKRVVVENALAPTGTATILPYISIDGHASGEVLNFDAVVCVAQPTASGALIIADSITATEIAAGAISTSELAANAVTSGTIAAGAITSATIAAGAVTAGAIAAGAVTASSIVAGAIDGKLITGATIQTSSSYPKTVLDSTGLWAANSGAIIQAQIDAANGLRLVSAPGYLDVTVPISLVSWHDGNVTGQRNSYLAGWKASTTAWGAEMVVDHPALPANTSHKTALQLASSSVWNDQNLIHAVVMDAAGNGPAGSVNIITGENRSSFLMTQSSGDQCSTVSAVTVFWSGASTSSTAFVTVPGATGLCVGVASCGTAGLDFGVPLVSAGSGGVTVQVKTAGGGTVGSGSTPVYVIAWGT